MSKSSRPSLRASLPPLVDEAAEATARAQELLRRQTTPPAPVEEIETGQQAAMTTSTIHLPVELLGALRAAANRRADRKMREDPRGRGGRPSVSEIVVELLTKYRDELDSMN
jgi:hypothetical protein